MCIQDTRFHDHVHTHVYSHPEYEWFEFTPFEVGGCDYLNMFVPSSHFGKRFKGGQLRGDFKEISFGMLLATFGSAFCATFGIMARELVGA